MLTFCGAPGIIHVFGGLFVSQALDVYTVVWLFGFFYIVFYNGDVSLLLTIELKFQFVSLEQSDKTKIFIQKEF